MPIPSFFCVKEKTALFRSFGPTAVADDTDGCLSLQPWPYRRLIFFSSFYTHTAAGPARSGMLHTVYLRLTLLTKFHDMGWVFSMSRPEVLPRPYQISLLASNSTFAAQPTNPGPTNHHFINFLNGLAEYDQASSRTQIFSEIYIRSFLLPILVGSKGCHALTRVNHQLILRTLLLIMHD